MNFNNSQVGSKYSSVLSLKFYDKCFVRILSVVVGCFSVFVLVFGYGFGFSGLTKLGSTVPMAAGVAVVLLIVSVSLFMGTRPDTRWRRRVITSFGILILLLGFTFIFEFSFFPTLNIFDNFFNLFSNLFGKDNHVHIAVNTAVNIVFFGIGIILLGLRRADGLRQSIGVVICMVSGTIILGFIANDTYRAIGDPISLWTATAPQTAISVLFLGVALIAVNVKAGWAKLFVDSGPGGNLVRIFLPLIILVPLVTTIFVRILSYVDFLAPHADQIATLVVTLFAGIIIFVVGNNTNVIDAEREVKQHELLLSEEKYRMLAENSTDIVWELDSDDIIVWVSSSVEKDLGWLPSQVVGMKIYKFVHSDDHNRLNGWKTRIRQGAYTPSLQLQGLDFNGKPKWMSLKGNLVVKENGQSIIIGMRNVNAEVSVRKELIRVSEQDPLTGLATLDIAKLRTEKLLTLAKSTNTKMAVFSIGIDSLKQVNESLNHAAGDRIIIGVAANLISELESPDMLTRSSGDEFLVLVSDFDNVIELTKLAEILRNSATGEWAGEAEIVTTVSIGIAISTDNITVDEIIRDATLAMHKAKENGKNRIEFFQSALADEAYRRVEMEKNIRHGLASQQFVAYYQPIVEISSQKIVGYEALVRWVLPDGEIMSPDDFLPIAEKTTLIADIDKQVLEQSIVKLSETVGVYISVNVSANSLSSGQYGQIVLDLLAKYDVDPKRLHIEFTETLLLKKIPVAEKIMTMLADVGIQWYVDDFGTGYSSISHLHDLPISGVKLDMSFTGGIRSRKVKSIRLAEGLVGLAKGLEIDTIAEGVETLDEAKILSSQGWVHGQGWLYGRPSVEFVTQ